MNPLNPDAGDTPAPRDAQDLELARRAAAVVWRLFPYFQRRYPERGPAFAQSDAAFLVTLAEHPPERAMAQVDWLAGLLAARGMPSVLLEYQLEALSRLGERHQRPWHPRLRALAAALRARRLSRVDAATASGCEQLCRAVRPAGLRGAGILIASAVADAAAGLGDEAALIGWLSACGGDRWSMACRAAQDRARKALAVGGAGDSRP